MMMLSNKGYTVTHPITHSHIEHIILYNLYIMLYYNICWYEGDIHKLALTYYNTEVIKLSN